MALELNLWNLLWAFEQAPYMMKLELDLHFDLLPSQLLTRMLALHFNLLLKGLLQVLVLSERGILALERMWERVLNQLKWLDQLNLLLKLP